MKFDLYQTGYSEMSMNSPYFLPFYNPAPGIKTKLRHYTHSVFKFLKTE